MLIVGNKKKIEGYSVGTIASHPFTMVLAPPSPHPATSLNSASGPVSLSLSTVTSYVTVEPPGMSA